VLLGCVTVCRHVSQSLHISAKAMLFARWQHHLRFCSGFPYAPFEAMVMKISKWSKIQDSFRITPKIESLVACAIPDIPSKFQKDPSITSWVILLTHRQTDKVWQKHYLLGRGNQLSFLSLQVNQVPAVWMVRSAYLLGGRQYCVILYGRWRSVVKSDIRMN